MTAEPHFRCDVPYAGEIDPIAFRGREAINRPYRFDVRLALRSADAPSFRRDALESRATLSFETPAGTRRVHGVIDGVSLGESLTQGRRRVDVRLVPRFDWLRLKKQSRIFQHLTTREIAEVVLREAGVRCRFELDEELPPRVYACQYRETDAAFVHRLFAEDGLFYWFDHDGDVETLVVTDAARAYRPIAGEPRLVVAPPSTGSAMKLEEHHATRTDARSRVRANVVVRRGHDARRPRADLRELSRTNAPGIDVDATSIGAGHREQIRAGLGHDDHLGTREELRPLDGGAQRCLESLRRGAEHVRGESVCRRLAAGHRLTIAGAGDEDVEVVLVGVRHHMRSVAEAVGSGSYTNTFDAVPVGTPWRPPPRDARPTATLDTATVVGPEGVEIHTDELGRVKVQFHWDMDGAHDERSSCWLRVGQSWAGAGFGAQFLPRVGMEVLVGFVGGDPDRPIIQGTVHNGVAPTPFSFPRDAHTSGIKTRSTPGGNGSHELVFGDDAGAEYIKLRSSKTLHVSAVDAGSLSAGSTLRIATGTDRADDTGGDARSRVGRDEATEVARDVSATVGRNATESIVGARTTSVGARDELRVGGPRSEIVGGSRTVVVGAGASTDLSNDHLTVTGRMIHSAGKDVSLTSGSAIHLRCGESVLSIMRDRILIASPRVQIQAPDEVVLAQGRGPDATLKLAGSAALGGGSVLVAAGGGANLELAASADLRGAQVHLGGTGAKAGAKLENVGDPGKARIKVRREWFPPSVTEVTLDLSTPTGERIERQCKPGETLELDGQVGEAFTLVGMRVAGVVVPMRPVGASVDALNGEG